MPGSLLSLARGGVERGGRAAGEQGLTGPTLQALGFPMPPTPVRPPRIARGPMTRALLAASLKELFSSFLLDGPESLGEKPRRPGKYINKES